MDHALRAEIWLALETLKPMAESLQNHMVRFIRAYKAITLHNVILKEVNEGGSFQKSRFLGPPSSENPSLAAFLFCLLECLAYGQIQYNAFFGIAFL